tara:strand:+ start:417 stop:893 length:477 start_codon:yes stop_codon:yes gene_type:complete
MADSEEKKYRSCVGLMVINDRKQFFTGQRLDFPSTAWQMPQGGIDKGEKPKDAAFRELKEETSIKNKNVELLAVSKGWVKYDLPFSLVSKLWNGKYIGQKQKWFLFKFLGDESAIDINTSEPEFSRWRWSSEKQLINSIVSFKKPVYQSILQEFREYL